MKHISALIITFSALLTLNVQGANRYVSDQLFTYMHSGPSAQFRIIGSANAGSAVKLIQNNQGSGYSKIVDAKGRTGWVETKFLTAQTPASIRLPEVEKALKAAQDELKTIADKNQITLDSKQQTLSKHIKTNNQLMSQRQDLVNQIKVLKTQNSQLQTRIDNQSEEVEMQWFIKGAGVIFAGIVIGLIVPNLPRRKKKSDSWA